MWLSYARKNRESVREILPATNIVASQWEKEEEEDEDEEEEETGGSSIEQREEGREAREERKKRALGSNLAIRE